MIFVKVLFVFWICCCVWLLKCIRFILVGRFWLVLLVVIIFLLINGLILFVIIVFLLFISVKYCLGVMLEMMWLNLGLVWKVVVVVRWEFVIIWFCGICLYRLLFGLFVLLLIFFIFVNSVNSVVFILLFCFFILCDLWESLIDEFLIYLIFDVIIFELLLVFFVLCM